MEEYSIPEATKIGWVRLRVSDLQNATGFYGRVVGLHASPVIGAAKKAAAFLSASGEPPFILYLEETPGAPRRPPRTSGLYHTAIRFPSRAGLGSVLQRIVLLEYPLGGVADHGVSEALYLSDPDGNGIELYADRPQDRWTVDQGRVSMMTENLDLNSLVQEAVPSSDREYAPPGTDIGHIHLQVADLERSKRFYHGLLGLDITQDTYPGALFLSAGGYHHHVGLNIWAGRGAPPPPENALGLEAFALQLPDEASLQDLEKRVEEAGYPVTLHELPGVGKVVSLHDPDGIGVSLKTGAKP